MLARLEQLHAHVLRPRGSTARGAAARTAGTARCSRRRTVPVELDAHVPGAVQDVDAVERIARVGDVALVLLVPGVEPVEVEEHVVAQVGIGGAERRRLRDRRRPPARSGPRRRWCGPRTGCSGRRPSGHRAGAPIAAYAGRWHVGSRRRGDELAGDVLDRHRVRRDHALRLPDEERAGRCRRRCDRRARRIRFSIGS